MRKPNKNGCIPTQDVCMQHERPLITFGMCEDSPQIKDFLRQEIRQAKIEMAESMLRVVEKYIENSADTQLKMQSAFQEAISNLKNNENTKGV